MTKRLVVGIVVCLFCLEIGGAAFAVDDATVEQIKIDAITAKDKVNNNDNKITELYDNVANLQSQIDNIRSFCSCDITRAEYDALLARATALEGGEPGCTVGDVRACDGSDIDRYFNVTQVCEDGVSWSSCEESGLPQLEICNDGIDNNCDGDFPYPERKT